MMPISLWGSGVPGWIGAISSSGLLAVGLAWRKQIFGEKVTLRSEHVLELAKCKSDFNSVSDRLDRLETRFNNQQIKLNATLIAYRILEVAHVAVDPGSIAIKQARAALRTAYALADESAELDQIIGVIP